MALRCRKSVAIATSKGQSAERLYGPIEAAKEDAIKMGKRVRRTLLCYLCLAVSWLAGQIHCVAVLVLTALLRMDVLGFGSSTRSPRTLDDVLLNAGPSDSPHAARRIARRARSMSPISYNGGGGSTTPSSRLLSASSSYGVVAAQIQPKPYVPRAYCLNSTDLICFQV